MILQIATSIHLVDTLLELKENKIDLFKFMLNCANDVNMVSEARSIKQQKIELEIRKQQYMTEHTKKL